MQEVQKEVQKLEQDFLRENNTWITTLDQNGNLKHADDFYFEITIDRRQQKELWTTNNSSFPCTISSI